MLTSVISVQVAAVNESRSSNSVAKPTGSVTVNPAIAPENSSQPPPSFPTYAAWRGYVAKVPTPSAGCFKATYPNPVWQRTKCGPPASGHLSPSQTSTTHSTHSEQVGNTNDWVAQSPAGTLIGFALGSFPSVTGLTSETDVCASSQAPCWNSTLPYDGGAGPNAYGLQLNTQIGFSVVSPYSDNAGVTGWEQFVYQYSEWWQRLD